MPSPKKPVAFQVRLPADLHKRLEASAKANGHSLNSELIERLQRSFGWGQLLLSLDDKWTTATFYRDELLIPVGSDSPQEVAVLKFMENMEAFKEHFGVKSLGGKK